MTKSIKFTFPDLRPVTQVVHRMTHFSLYGCIHVEQLHTFLENAPLYILLPSLPTETLLLRTSPSPLLHPLFEK